MLKPPKLYGVKTAPNLKHWPHLILDVDVLDGINNISGKCAVAIDRLVAPNDIKMVVPMFKTF